MKNVIVTGAAGFIGSHLTEKLLNMGITVIGIDDLSAGKEENMDIFSYHPNFTFFQNDVTNYGSMKCIFENIDTVFHLAASKKTVCLKDPMRDLEVNAKGTYNMLLLSEQFGVNKFVHASTGSVYGESVNEVQDENFHISPCSFYGISKFAGERYVNLFNKHRGLDTTILRFFHVYGSKQDAGEFGGVIAIFSHKFKNNEPVTIFGDGKQQRYFTHVSDVVESCILSATNPISEGQIYNVACDNPIGLLTATEILADILGVNPEINFEDWTVGDIKYFNTDNTKIKKELGIRFKTFQEGIKKINPKGGGI